MAKLAQLVETMANNSGLSIPTVALVARHLREAGLVSTGGRGPGGAEMTPTDATNLLIGSVAAIQVKDAPAVVQMFRGAAPATDHVASNDHKTAGLSIRDFGRLKFGPMLDELFRRLIEDSDVTDLSTGSPVDLKLEFQRTGHDYGAHPRLIVGRDIEGVSTDQRFEYFGANPVLEALPHEDWKPHLRAALKKGVLGLSISIVVSEHLIFPLGDCLAGRKDEDSE